MEGEKQLLFIFQQFRYVITPGDLTFLCFGHCHNVLSSDF